MGGKCSPSGGINPPIYDNNLKNIKEITGKPNSRTDLYDENGNQIQGRWYDEHGLAIRDRHYTHGDSLRSHEFPHDHEWGWLRKRGKYKFLPLKSEAPSPDFC